jgi:transcriptional regulator with XRE-family HTH domain
VLVKIKLDFFIKKLDFFRRLLYYFNGGIKMNSKFYDNSIFANNLKRLLEDKDMTAAELARRMKISKSAVSDWLKGKSLPRTDKVDMICEILSCERDQFTKNTPSNILDITGLIPDSTRHTYNSMLNRAGVDTATRMKLMGQVSEATNQRVYTHTDLEQMKKAVNALG